MLGGEARRLPDTAGYEIWLLCLGWLDFEPGQVLPDEPASICVNALLLRGHAETLLVDAGSGPVDVLWPGAAALDEALASAGFARADVDAVVLTHMDFDHSGGALQGTWPDDLRPAFGRVILSEIGIDWWRQREPDEWNAGTRIVEVYEAAGGLELVADGVEFRPQLRLVSAPGHRQGHSVLLVGDELVHGADLLHHASHVEHPDWDGYYDVDVVQALDTRQRWFAHLAADATPVVFSHLAERGRIAPGPRWQPDA